MRAAVMGLAITDEHLALAQVICDFSDKRGLRQETRAALDNGASEALPTSWTELAGQGWLALHVPEQFGGSGYGLSEAAVVMEQLGAACAPGVALPTFVAAAVL